MSKCINRSISGFAQRRARMNLWRRAANLTGYKSSRRRRPATREHTEGEEDVSKPYRDGNTTGRVSSILAMLPGPIPATLRNAISNII